MLPQDFIQSGYTTEPCPADPRPHQHPHLPPRSHSPLPVASERAWAGTPSLEGPRSLPDSGRASPCMRDGEFFLRLLQTEVERMEGWCQNMEREAEENELPEEGEFGRTIKRIRDKDKWWIILGFLKVLVCCFLPSSRADPKCSWQCPDAHVSESPAVLPPLPTKCGEYVWLHLKSWQHTLDMVRGFAQIQYCSGQN